MRANLSELTQPVRQHWPYVYHRRRQKVLGINAKQMAWGQVASLIGSVIAGVLLDTHKETLALLAGAFVVLPGIFDLDGSIGAALSAKINHLSEKTNLSARRVLYHTVWFALRQAILAGVLVGLMGASIAVLFFDAMFWHVFLIGVGAVTISAVLGFPLIGLLSIFFRRLSINPDDVVGPIESSLFDILAVITTVIMVEWLL
jgi:cation transporter-like permease